MKDRHLPKPRPATTLLRVADRIGRTGSPTEKENTATEQAQNELQSVSENTVNGAAFSVNRIKSVLTETKKHKQRTAVKEKAVSDTISRQRRQAASAKRMSRRDWQSAAQRAENFSRTKARLQSVVTRVKRQIRNRSKTAAKAALRGIPHRNSGLLIVGAAVVVVVLLSGISLAGLLFGSSFGIFFSNESENGMTMRDAVAEIGGSYYAEIGDLQAIHPHDAVEIISDDGTAAIRWPQVLSVYAALLTKGDDTGVDVVTVTEEKKETLKALFWEMNELSVSTRPRMREVEKTVTDEYGEQQTVTETLTETVLQIHIARKTPEEMAARHSFDASQTEQLLLLLDDEYASFWSQLLGTDTAGGIGNSDTSWIPTGSLSWPLPPGGVVTSGFGYRSDPISGETKLHGGLDIAADTGTPVLAADAGTVIVSDASDAYGGYGYYVMLDHGNGIRTLYGHCSALCVAQGQTVAKGEIIALVGSTGYSTGPHLHFEVYTQGQRVDPMSFFVAG